MRSDPHLPRRGSLLLAGAPCLRRGRAAARPVTSVATDRAAAVHRVRARLGSGRAVRWATTPSAMCCSSGSACMSRPSSRSGCSTMSGSIPRRGAAARKFVFDAGQFLTGLAVGLPAAALAALWSPGCSARSLLSMRGHYFAICTLGLGIAAGQLAAGIPWIGAGSGMLTPNPPADLGDVGLLLYYLALGLAVRLHAHFRLAAVDPVRARAERHQGRRGQGRGDGPQDPRRQGDGLGDRRRVPRYRRRALRQSGALHRSGRDRLCRSHHRRVDDPDGAARRQGHAARADRRRDRVPAHQGAVLDLSARLAEGRARRADRSGRRVLPDRHRRLRAASALAAPTRRTAVVPRSAAHDRHARARRRHQSLWRHPRQ